MNLYRLTTTNKMGQENTAYVLYDNKTNYRSPTFAKESDLVEAYYNLCEDDTDFYNRFLANPDVEARVVATIPSPLDFLLEQNPELFL
jgi:hypothetical protein